MMTRQQFFNEAAYSWDEQFRSGKLRDFLKDFVPQFGLKRGDNVVDVGSGTGLLIPYLLQAIGPAGHVTAVDYAEKMLAACKAKYARRSNVDFLLQDIENFALSSALFDAVVCFGVFPHLNDKSRALRQMNRVLKCGGRLIIAHALSSQQMRRQHHRASPVVAQDRLPTNAEMYKLLKQSGFGKICILDKPGQYIATSQKTPDKIAVASPNSRSQLSPSGELVSAGKQ